VARWRSALDLQSTCNTPGRRAAECNPGQVVYTHVCLQRPINRSMCASVTVGTQTLHCYLLIFVKGKVTWRTWDKNLDEGVRVGEIPCNFVEIMDKIKCWIYEPDSHQAVNLVPAQAEKVTVGLVLHWPCVTDNSHSGTTTYGLTALGREMSTLPTLQ